MSDLAVRVVDLWKAYRPEDLRARGRTLKAWLGERLGAVGRRAAEPTEPFWALRGVSFGVRRGSIVGVVGRNGMGKSTLLRVLTRVTAPTAGRVEIRGRIGAVLDVGTGFQPELTGRENVFLSAAILGMRRVEIARRFDRIVEFAEMGSFVDVPVKRYSTGMAMRLAFSITAHLDVDVLFVDEVLAVGDVGFQHKSVTRIRALAAEGRTVVVVSHDVTTLGTLADDGVLLDRGRVVHTGPIGEVLERHLASWSDPDIAAPEPVAAAAAVPA